MVFVYRRVNGEEFDKLVQWCLENDVKYALKAFGKTLMFGMYQKEWRRIDFGALSFNS